jgi:N-acyl-phosphatidylethanolamine-hydrolysing phospholipase D
MKKNVLLLSLLIISFSLGSCTWNVPPFDEGRWRNNIEQEEMRLLYTDHFKDGEYFNPWMPMARWRFMQVLTWRFSANRDNYTPEESSCLPKIYPELSRRIPALPNGDFIAWIGHGTFLVRIQGEYWITDPIFSERALIPKRLTPPALTADDLNAIASHVNVIISHNHYDHLDAASMRSLSDRARVYVPRGLKKAVENMNKKSVVEMDWWDSIDCGNGVTLVCLPAQHWSRRIGQGHNETLWASFLLVTPNVKIYYGGDSGYFVGYKEIGGKHRGIDYALLPVTAQHPRWIMHYNHMNTREALDAFRDLGAKYLIPTQWGTFRLGDEPAGYGAFDLRRLTDRGDVDPSRVRIPSIGEIVSIPAAP